MIGRKKLRQPVPGNVRREWDEGLSDEFIRSVVIAGNSSFSETSSSRQSCVEVIVDTLIVSLINYSYQEPNSKWIIRLMSTKRGFLMKNGWLLYRTRFGVDQSTIIPSTDFSIWCLFFRKLDNWKEIVLWWPDINVFPELMNQKFEQ